MITKLPNEFLSVISENNGLKQYLSNLDKGREFTPRSWLYEHMEPDTILQNWLSELDTLQSGTSFEKEVFQFDTSQVEKWGPQGGIAPIQDLMKEIVMPTFSDSRSPRPQAFNTPEWDLAKGTTLDNMRNNGVALLRPASYSHVVDDMRARDTLESNSGWPLFTRRNKPEVVTAAIAAAENGEWVDFPAIALFRNYNQKTRLVWMFPMATNLVEGSFFQPLQSSIIKAKLQMYTPWIGFEAVRKLVTRTYAAGKFISASDFTSTDAHFQLSSTFEVFDVLRFIFQKLYSGTLRQSLERMHTIPLIVGVDKMVTGNHGVSSGSNWTNFIETVFDDILGYYVQIKSDHNSDGLYAIGDDMAWVHDKFNDAFDSQLEKWGEEVGQVIKADKTNNYPDRVKTLQRLFQRGYSRPDGLLRGVYSTVRALKSSVYPERFHKPNLWSSDMFCARQFMILENCVDHPLFERFVKFVCKGHEDLIPFARKSASELDKILRETKLLPGFNPTYNQEKRDTSLASFESVKLAKTL
nr:MAG: RNA-dependent RNA-polymerase [Picobirnavirus sp.]